MTHEQAGQNIVSGKLVKSKDSVSASEELGAKTAETDKLLRAARAKMTSLKKKVARADSENEESNRVIAEAS